MSVVNMQLKASGTIRTSRFIKHDTTENASALEADAAEVTIGISSEGAQDAPIPGASANAAEDGDSFMYHPQGQEALLELGTGGCTAGDRLKSDADGKGVTTTTDTDWYGALAYETAVAGDKARVLVQGGFVSV